MDLQEIIDSSIKEMKSIFQSKVFWVAVIQAISGIVIVFSSAYPTVGGLIIAKSVIDILLRFATTVPVSL